MTAMLTFLPAVLVFAANPGEVGEALYTSDIFAPFERFNLINDIGLILPIVVAWFAIRVAKLMQGGKFEKVWKLIAAGMSVLAIMKVIDGLEDLGVLQVTGLRSLLEFVMILVFFSAFLVSYRSLQLAIRGPAVEKPVITIPKEEAEQAKQEEEKKEKEKEKEKQEQEEEKKEVEEEKSEKK